ncbi:hypothetical protein J7E91_16695 [Streptomyces sp. ISL-99]|uniref:hypothetical protein n=1 Tax=Streptomyces sp. ISL-99 TaxID=2819193 RepID=UPI001BE9C5A8|nr:hypothetical protein [Streptomyces sp. ISL-99]MBT2527017.1 hypothetical protein [Streptomyces sp. ISL-99]
MEEKHLNGPEFPLCNGQEGPSGGNQPDLKFAAKLSVSEVREIVDRAAVGSAADSWWEGMRTLCVGRMQDVRRNASERIEWGRLAVKAIHSKREGDPDPKIPLAAEARIRAYVIREFGKDQEDDFRNPVALCGQVIAGVDSELDSVAFSASRWREAGRAEMLRLRRIKNLLQSLVEIKEFLDPGDPLCRKVATWLELIPSLP